MGELGKGEGYAHVLDEFFWNLACDDLLPTPRVQSTSYTSILIDKPDLYSLVQAPYIPISANIPNLRLTFLKLANNAISILCGYEFLTQLSLEPY